MDYPFPSELCRNDDGHRWSAEYFSKLFATRGARATSSGLFEHRSDFDDDCLALCDVGDRVKTLVGGLFLSRKAKATALGDGHLTNTEHTPSY